MEEVFLCGISGDDAGFRHFTLPPKLHMSQDLRWGFSIGNLRLFYIEISVLSLAANLLHSRSSLRRGF